MGAVHLTPRGLLAPLLTLLLLLASPIRAATGKTVPWPNGPFRTSTHTIVDNDGRPVTYAGVNWPGAADTMVPEGLQYQSIARIVAKIKDLGLNSVRLTWATEMVDQIIDNNGTDVSLRTAFVNALGRDNGTAIFDRVVKNNPAFGNGTTRLQVYDAIAAECAKQQIYVHLDNHVSKAGWCCTPIDGNAWWGDKYFDTANWTRGLSHMADHGRNWPNLMSMSLRNELRQPLLNLSLMTGSYNWQTWYQNVLAGAKAVHESNPNVLVFLSGLDSDTTLTPVVQGTALTPGNRTFERDDFGELGARHQLVLELHNYANILGGAALRDCGALRAALYDDGFQALSDNATNELPVVLSEFGYAQDDAGKNGAGGWNGTFARCLEAYVPASGAGWMLWVLAGSYYVREGKQDYDEPWGLLNHDWSDWRSPAHVEQGLRPMVAATLGGGSGGSGSGSNGGGGGGSASGNATGGGGNGTGGNGGAGRGGSGAATARVEALMPYVIASCAFIISFIVFVV